MSTDSIKAGSEKEEILLKFMAMTIERINSCNASMHAMQTLMIEKGVATEKEILQYIKDSKDMPRRKIGKRVLAEILKEPLLNNLSQMVHLPE